MIYHHSIKPIIIFCLVVTSMHQAHAQWDEFFKAFRRGNGTDMTYIGLSRLRADQYANPFLGINLKRGFISETSLFSKKITTFYSGSMSYYYKQEKQTAGAFTALPVDTALQPQLIPFVFKQSVSYLMFDLHSDYCFIKNKKETFFIYAGWALGISIPFYKGSYDVAPFDPSLYTLQTTSSWNRTRKFIKADFFGGLEIGFEKSISKSGAIYFDSGFLVNLRPVNYLPADFTILSVAFLRTNLGYRYKF